MVRNARFALFGMFPTQPVAGLMAALLLLGSGLVMAAPAQAEKYQSRLSQLLLKKANLYLPTRLVLGEEARFVVKAPAGHLVRLLVSTQAQGFVLPDGTPMRVGEDYQVLGGTVPESGVLELMLEMPDSAELEGKMVYVDALAGPTESQLVPIELVDATGRRTAENALVIAKPATPGAPMILPTMPGGVSPQVFSQLTTLGEIYSQDDEHRKQLLDTGEINQEREADQNPFARRGVQPGL